MKRHHLRHTARLQKLLTDSCCSKASTSTRQFRKYILNIWIHKMLLGLSLQWSMSLAGEKSQYLLLIFAVNKLSSFIWRWVKRETKTIKLNFSFVSNLSLLEAKVTSPTALAHHTPAPPEKSLSSGLHGGNRGQHLACSLRFPERARERGTAIFCDTEQSCCHARALPHGGTEERERPPALPARRRL